MDNYVETNSRRKRKRRSNEISSDGGDTQTVVGQLDGHRKKMNEDDDDNPITVESRSAAFVESGKGLVTHFPVNLLSHCIFCLRRTVKTCESVSSQNPNRTGNGNEQLQIVPRAELSSYSSSPTLLFTFNRIWSYISGILEVGCTEQKNDDLIDLKILLNDKITFSELPRICQFCEDALHSIDKLFHKLKCQLDAIKRITQDSRYHGKFSWRAELFERTLFTSNLDAQVIDATTIIFGDFGRNSALFKNEIAPPHPEDTETIQSLQNTTETETEIEIDPLYVLSMSSPAIQCESSEQFIDEDIKWNASDSDHHSVISEPEEKEVDSQSSSEVEISKIWSKPKTRQHSSTPSAHTDSLQSQQNSKNVSCSSSRPSARTSDHQAKSMKKQIQKSRIRLQMEAAGTFSSTVDPISGEEVFTCKINDCGTVCSTWSDISKHQRQKHPSKLRTTLSNQKLNCDECGKLFADRHNLSTHMKRIHKVKTPNLRSQVCDLCKLEIPLKDIFEHVRAHVGEEYLIRCVNADCPHVFSNSRSLFQHLSSSGGTILRACGKNMPNIKEILEETQATTCHLCGLKTTNRLSLRGHLLRIHETPTKNFSCPIKNCPQKFTVKQSVQLHIAYHDMRAAVDIQNCAQCGLARKIDKEMESHLKETHGAEEVFKCNRCPFLFQTRELLVEHMIAHRYGVLSCDICGEHVRFSRHVKLREHYFNVHQVGQRFLCEHCNQVSWTEKNWILHSKTHDNKDDFLSRPLPESQRKKRYKCDLCDSTFGMEYRLRDHKIRKHGAEPYSCKTCNKVFLTSGQLFKHEMEHKGNETRKKTQEFKCDVEGCGKTFKQRKNLETHMSSVHRGERPHICELCGKSYAHDSGLNLHKTSVHLNLRSHFCDTCGESFASGNLLKRHSRIHTGVRDYACEICGQKFGYKEVLKRHLEGHRRKGADFKPNGPMKHVRKRVERKAPIQS